MSLQSAASLITILIATLSGNLGHPGPSFAAYRGYCDRIAQRSLNSGGQVHAGMQRRHRGFYTIRASGNSRYTTWLTMRPVLFRGLEVSTRK
jgi:hypothetical protein